MNSIFIDSFIKKFLEFVFRVRAREGANESLYEELVKLLSEISAVLQDIDSIPKNLAAIFVDMYGALTCCADLHEDEMQQRVYVKATLRPHERSLHRLSCRAQSRLTNPLHLQLSGSLRTASTRKIIRNQAFNLY